MINAVEETYLNGVIHEYNFRLQPATAAAGEPVPPIPEAVARSLMRTPLPAGRLTQVCLLRHSPRES
jgi:hypothetical protein